MLSRPWRKLAYRSRHRGLTPGARRETLGSQAEAAAAAAGGHLCSAARTVFIPQGLTVDAVARVRRRRRRDPLDDAAAGSPIAASRSVGQWSRTTRSHTASRSNPDDVASPSAPPERPRVRRFETDDMAVGPASMRCGYPTTTTRGTTSRAKPVRVVGHRRARRGHQPPRDDGSDVPDHPHPPGDHRPGGGHQRRHAPGTLQPGRRLRRGAQRAHPRRSLARGRGAA
jgi:hypothetical protein